MIALDMRCNKRKVWISVLSMLTIAVSLLVTSGQAHAITGTSYICESDEPTDMVQMCIYQYWTDKTVNGQRYVAVDHYRATWTRLDRQAALKSGTLLAGVSSPGIGTTQSWTVNAPASGASYNFYPSWRGQYLLVTNIFFTCAQGGLIWSRGVSTYQFNISPPGVCQGHLPS